MLPGVGEASITWAASQTTGIWHDLCLKFVRMSFGAPGGAPTAYDAWQAAAHKHVWVAYPPRAVPVFWAGGQGHVALSLGDGTCYSTDVRRDGYVNRVAISSITQQWGLQPLGWTEDINGLRVYNGPSAHILHLLHLAHIGAPLTDHELHELHLYTHPNG